MLCKLMAMRAVSCVCELRPALNVPTRVVLQDIYAPHSGTTSKMFGAFGVGMDRTLDGKTGQA